MKRKRKPFLFSSLFFPSPHVLHNFPLLFVFLWTPHFARLSFLPPLFLFFSSCKEPNTNITFFSDLSSSCFPPHLHTTTRHPSPGRGRAPPLEPRPVPERLQPRHRHLFSLPAPVVILIDRHWPPPTSPPHRRLLPDHMDSVTAEDVEQHEPAIP